ncbi:tsukushin isoform X1 [Bufo bufo]|uniref:tsukushin isoform X1 n=2 Tax=Bufo bufo TaxID=8384 RepID=UPI001ABEB56B|nr:tsukushin isoform X1 [Bufo bufo]
MICLCRQSSTSRTTGSDPQKVVSDRPGPHIAAAERCVTMGPPSWFSMLFITSIVAASKPCFPGCSCEVETFGLFDSFSLTKVDCSGVGSHIVPVSIPLDTSYLDLSSNKLEHVNDSVLSGPGYTTLVNLNLSYNQMVKISSTTFSKLRYLESLDLSHNRLEALPDHSFFYSPLVELDVSFNKLEEIKIGAFTSQNNGKAMNIDLSNNLISTLSRGSDSPLPNVRSLNLSANRLRSVQGLQGIPLQSLNLDKNPISKIEEHNFLGLKSLTHLSLSNMPDLREIAPRSFSDIQSLLVLDLSNNPNLVSLSEEVFFGLRSLQELNLLNSGVQSLPKDTIHHLPSMKSITWGTDIHCIKTMKEDQFHLQNGLVRREVLVCRNDRGAVSAQDVL